MPYTGNGISQSIYMKKYISLFLFLLISNFTVQACEICGCGVGNLYIGQLPGFKTRFVGIRYQYMRYKSEMATDKSQFSKDAYQTTELWAGWNIGSRWQVLAFVPWRFNKKISDDGIKQNNGLGDISLLANYSLLHTRSTNLGNKIVEQQVWTGAGIKLATGAYHVDLTDPTANIGDANSQNGTGSVSYLFNTQYQLRIGQNGMAASLQYQANTTNAEGYRFGNRFTGALYAYHRYRINGVSLSPNLGLLFDHNNSNSLNHETVAETGGHRINLTGGVEIGLKRFSIGLNTQLPLQQQYASGQTLLTNHTVLHLSIAF